MNTLETKVNALLRLVAAEDPAEQENAKLEIRNLLNGGDAPTQKSIVNKTDLHTRILAVLTELGVPACLKGHRCLVEALKIVVKDPAILTQVTQRLYVETGKACNTTATRTERAIRHAVEVAWDRGDLDVLQKYFGNTVSPSKGKPTNSEFIAQVANALLLQGAL